MEKLALLVFSVPSYAVRMTAGLFLVPNLTDDCKGSHEKAVFMLKASSHRVHRLIKHWEHIFERLFQYAIMLILVWNDTSYYVCILNELKHSFWQTEPRGILWHYQSVVRNSAFSLITQHMHYAKCSSMYVFKHLMEFLCIKSICIIMFKINPSDPIKHLHSQYC